jgi:FKBP-type peptidyl-prolyl cis-trans isomerase FkpA
MPWQKCHILILSLYLVCIGIFSSCQPDIDVERNEIILTLDRLSLEVDTTIDDIFIIINEPGSAEKPNDKSIVTIRYLGQYLDDMVFDSTHSTVPLQLNLSNAILGLRKSIPFFGRNGRGKIFIPSNQGYGSNPPRGIKKNSILHYDIEVIDF